MSSGHIPLYRGVRHQKTPMPGHKKSCWEGEPAWGALSLKAPLRCTLRLQKQPPIKAGAWSPLAREQKRPIVATER